MNILEIVILISIIIALIVGITQNDMVGGIDFGYSVFSVGLMVSFVIVMMVYSRCNDMEEEIRLIVDNNVTNEQLEHEIDDLIKKTTDGKSFDVVVNINDTDTDKLKIKNIQIKFKYSLLSEDVYVNSGKSFKIYVKQDNS